MRTPNKIKFAKWVAFWWTHRYPFNEKPPHKVVHCGPVFSAPLDVLTTRGMVMSRGIFIPKPGVEDFTTGCGVLVLSINGSPDPGALIDHTCMAVTQALLLDYLSIQQVMEIMTELHEKKKNLEQTGGGFAV